MRSTSKYLQVILVVAALIGVAGCSGESVSSQSIPRIVVDGSRARSYNSLDDLADKANAIAIVKPTGEQKSVPLPRDQGGTADSAPITFVEMEVVRVISGSLQGDVVNVVSPGIDANTGGQALLSGGPYLVFLAPAMYGINAPVGGYVIVGGPAGVFAKGRAKDTFLRLDDESTSLPSEVVAAGNKLPKITKTEAELLSEGP